MGATQSGINYGIINATTDEELGNIVNPDGQLENFIVEPQTNYTVVDLKNQLLINFPVLV